MALNLDVNDLVTEEEMKATEEQPVVTAGKKYNRQLFCAQPDRIQELVTNVFVPAIKKDANGEDIMFYESSEDTIKWSTDELDATQLIIVEGLLSHRMQAGLLKDMYETMNQAPLKVFPGDAAFLQGTVFLGGIKDEKQYNQILQNVVRIANIPIENNDKIACFSETVNPAMPQSQGLVMALIGLDVTEMANLKRAAKTRKTADKVKKFTQQANTVGFGLTKAVMDDIANPLLETAGKIGGAVVSGTVTGTFKGATTFANEVVTGVVHADLGNYEPYKELKSNSKKLFASLGANKTTDSYSFSF